MRANGGKGRVLADIRSISRSLWVVQVYPHNGAPIQTSSSSREEAKERALAGVVEMLLGGS